MIEELSGKFVIVLDDVCPVLATALNVLQVFFHDELHFALFIAFFIQIFILGILVGVLFELIYEGLHNYVKGRFGYFFNAARA